MDVAKVVVVRDLLRSTGWVERTAGFAQTMRRSTREIGGLLIVGTPEAEPWHLTAHLDEESRRHDIPELRPTLVRHRVPDQAPPHLSVTLSRLEAAGRGETVMLVAEQTTPDSVLERSWDARKAGATVLSVDGGNDELTDVAQERLSVDSSAVAALQPIGLDDVLTFDTVQHLVSVAAGETDAYSARGLRARVARLLDAVSGPRHDHDAW